MNFFISLSSRRIINIQYNPSVSNSLKRYKAVNFEPKLRKILAWFSRQWLVALIMHLHCFESACNCKFHYTMNSYNAWLLSEDVPKTCWDWDKIGGDPRLLTCLNFSLTPCHKNLSGTLTEHSSFPFALTANRSLRLLLTLRFALTAVSLSIVIVMLTWYISTFFGTSSESNQAQTSVSTERKRKATVLSVPDKFLWQGVNVKFKQVSRRGSPPILSQSQHVFGTSSESNQALYEFMM